MRLERYIITILGKSFLTLLIIFLVISISSKANDILGGFVSRNMPADTLFTVLWSFIAEIVLVVFGLSLFISVILMLTSLNASSEMPIFFSSGLSRGFLFKCVVWFVAPLVPFMLWLALFYSPLVKISGKIAFETARDGILLNLQPNDLQSFGSSMMYAQSQSDEGVMQGFFARYTSDQKPFFISASEATPFMRSGEPWIRLKNGFQWHDTDSDDFRIMHFEEFEIALPNLNPKDRDFTVHGVAFLPLTELIANRNNPAHRTEIHWRFSYVISAVLMALLAVFLVPYKPRTSRFTHIALGLLVFVIFATAITTLKDLASSGEIHPDIAFGGVYLVLSAFLVVAWIRHNKAV